MQTPVAERAWQPANRTDNQMHCAIALITCMHAFMRLQGDGRYVISNSKDQSIKL